MSHQIDLSEHVLFYGYRENIITHITDIDKLSAYYKIDRERLYNFLAQNINAPVNLSGSNIKIKGLINYLDLLQLFINISQ